MDERAWVKPTLLLLSAASSSAAGIVATGPEGLNSKEGDPYTPSPVR